MVSDAGTQSFSHCAPAGMSRSHFLIIVINDRSVPGELLRPLDIKQEVRLGSLLLHVCSTVKLNLLYIFIYIYIVSFFFFLN